MYRKRITILFTIISLIIVSVIIFNYISYRDTGNVDNVRITIGSSEKFNKSEINGALKSTKKYFQKDFKGCVLLNLKYDEGKSKTQIQSYLESGRGSINNEKKENIIVLFSDFYVNKGGGDGSLNMDFTYTNWSWTLVRNIFGIWKVDSYGM